MITKLRELLLALVLAATAAVTTPCRGRSHQHSHQLRCEPANRPAFRTYLQHDMLARLAKLKQAGVLSSYQILFNPFTQPPPGMRWRSCALPALRRRSAGGRSSEPSRADSTQRVCAWPSRGYLFGGSDLARQADDPGSPGDSVFYVIPYEYSSADQYRKYVDAYVNSAGGWLDA